MENIVTKEQMESLKALSDVNIKISEARNLLFKLQEEETEYLVGREKKAMERIQKVIEDSQSMVREANENYSQIQQLLNGVSDFAGKLQKMQEDFQGLLADFEERNVEWERTVGKQQDGIVDIRNQLKIEQVQIKNDKETIELTQKRLIESQRKLDSDRGTLERTIERLKNNNL